MQKSRQLGILKAMGLKNSQSSIIFMQTSFVIGIIGSTVGTIFGFGLFYGFINGVKDADGLPVFAPIVRGQYVFVTWAVTVAASTLAGFIPARKSAKLDPIEIIQNE
jgi:lipoprotein-releasing system permease protein